MKAGFVLGLTLRRPLGLTWLSLRANAVSISPFCMVRLRANAVSVSPFYCVGLRPNAVFVSPFSVARS